MAEEDDHVGVVDIDGLAFTYEEYEQLKTLLHSERFRELAYSERRYFVLGAGDAERADRRQFVADLLDGRSNAISFRLEDVGLTTDELPLWTAAYEILCDRATHIVVVLEDYDGGYVWELGYLFHDTVREKVWVLKREYGNEEMMLKRYDNGMAASHVKVLENAERTIPWTDSDDLGKGIERIP